MPDQIIAHTPLNGSAADDFIFKRLTGRESLSTIYQFSAEFLSRHNDLDINSLLGKDMALEIKLAGGGSRYLHGHITRVDFSGYDLQQEKYKLYTVTLHPALWYLTQNRDCRIWQEKTIPDIIGAVLAEFNIAFENLLSSAYTPHPYCVQYQESTFAFLSRLMEHEGIYYYFKHDARGHTLVLSDSPLAHRPFPGYQDIAYQQPGYGLTDHREGITRWNMSQRVTPELCSIDDYDFRKPRAHLAQSCLNGASFAAGKTELFDWPGRYEDNQQGQFLAQIRQQACAAGQQQVCGQATARGLSPGHTFRIHNCPRPLDEQNYLVAAVEYSLCDSRYRHENDRRGGGQDCFSVEFTVVPATVPWRPARLTPWPKTHGPQTAEVAGPVDKTIWTDKYGRVKLKFRWDRRGAGDDTGSCWVRVSSQWAGWKYGSLQVPRVGEEVIVDFINGDPDRPIITGRVYNQESLPPWELPAAAARMGFMSRSKEGGVGNASFWFMEDAPGQESFSLHAERDMNITVERDKHVSVDGNLARQIKGRTQFIHLGSCTTRKLQPDMQTFHRGKSALITAGGRADAIIGGEYKQVTGPSRQRVSEDLCRHAGGTISHHALDSIMFDAGNKIIFGASLYLAAGHDTEENPAQTGLAAAHGPTAREIADRQRSRRQQSRREPTRVVYTKGVNQDINGVDQQRIAGNQDIEAQGDVTRDISGRWREHVRQDLSIRAGGDATLNAGGKVLIETKEMVHNIEGHIETHSAHALNVTGFSQSIDSMSFSMSKMAVKTNEILTSTTKVNLAKTDIRMETVGVNIGQGQLDIRTTLLSLNTSAITLFL